MAHSYDVISSRRVHEGRVTALRSDLLAMPDGDTSTRDVVELPGAIAIVALDNDGQVLLVEQYRHPVGRRLWEVPAGLLDSTTETPLEAGTRELAEEGFLTASRWDTLADILTSPGGSDETIRLLLARSFAEVPVSERAPGLHEEAEMVRRWVPLAGAVEAIFTGELENGISVAALLTADHARRNGFAGLRPANAPWRARKAARP